jgi:hypothetical protein
VDDVSLWVSPVVLVSGVGLLILSTSARYGQIHAELRELIRDAHDGTFPGDAVETLYEHLHTRTRLLLTALFGLYLSVGFLITGSLVGVISGIWSLSHIPVIVLTCAGILGVVYAALQLIRESRIFLHTVDICVHRVAGQPSDTDTPLSGRGIR